MGLDMILSKTKKVEGFTVQDYAKINKVVSGSVNSEKDIQELNLEALTGIENANELISSIEKKGKNYTWYSFYVEVGYWRKANQIHNWFVQNVQNGVDECQLTIVSKEKLEELLETVKEVLKNKAKDKQLLPSRSGFFFGSTDYDEWYFEDLKNTKKILTKVLKETDFEKEVIFYQSSW